MKKVYLVILAFVLLYADTTKAQCVAGSTLVTWEKATTGTRTVVPSYTSAGGPPAAINDTTVSCTTNNIFTLSISDPNNVYDRIRSSTSGTSLGSYGSPYYTITMDNIDGGCGTGAFVNPAGGCTAAENASYAPGSKIIITFTFQHPVLMNTFRIDDIDASDFSNPPAGSSSFQDRVVFSALSATGANVPISLSVGGTGVVTISGQTATAVWPAGVNNNVSPDDVRGQVTATSAIPIKSFTMEYVAGPNEPNPAQQTIRLGQFTICCPNLVTLSGNVFNDVNGLTANTVNGTGLGNPGGTTLYANLTDPVTGKVVAVVPVNADGTYNFTNVVGQFNYNIILSTTQGTVGAVAPSTSLPAGWVNVGENVGSGAGSDGTPNGILSVTVASSNITNANFGIQQPPTPSNLTAISSLNPGGTTSVAVPPATFAGTDPDGGTISSIKITAFPSNATSITINGTLYTSATFPVGGVTVPTNATGQPTQTISVDPVNGATTVVIPYKVIDNAGVESPATGTASMPFTTISLSGNVYNDVNGLNGAPANTVDGTGIGSPSGTQLYANLISGGLVVGTVPVNADGTYTFPVVNPNTAYTVQLTTNQGTVGAAAPATSLPSNWTNTGENLGASAGNDGAANGQLAVTTGTTNTTNANFGIEQLPNSGVVTTPSTLNGGGTISYIIPASYFSGTDPDAGSISSIRITAFPTNATSISINVNTTYYPNAGAIPGVCPTTTCLVFPGAGVTIPTNAAGQPTQQISVDPLGTGTANIIVTIPYAAIDNAGKEDPTPGNVTIPFTSTANVSGNVFNDVNGLNGTPANTVDGTGTGLPSGTQLYAYLVNNLGNVVKRIPVGADGKYSFTDVADATYTVRVTTDGTVNPGAAASLITMGLPPNWVNTGENNSTAAGSDGTPNGISASFTVSGGNDVNNINFGIEQLPNSGVNVQPAQANPGGTTSVTVPASAFSGTDPDGGTISSIRITAFPTNATSISINANTTYYPNAGAIPGVCPTATCLVFPGGGVTVPTNAAGQPTQTISIDPINGNVTAAINYATIDNAGKEDPTPGSVSLPFSSVNLSGNVYNDLDALTNSTVDGALVSGVTLYANSLDATGTTVIATVPVTGGTYNFTNILGNTNYVVQLSTNQGTVGQPKPTTTLPTNWVNTGENVGTGAGNDGTVNGLLPVNLGASNVSNANFGIQQLPNSGTNTQPNQANPGGTTSVTVPASAFSGTDPDGGTISSIRITAFPTNATSITIDGTTYTAATFPAGGVTVPTTATGQPTQTISVDPVDGTVNVVIPYATIDNAGKEDLTPGSVTMPFSNLSIAGNVFNDGNGMNGTPFNTVDGTGIGSASGSQLYANLLDETGTTVLATVPVNADGTFNFFGAAPNTNYIVQISKNQGIVGSGAPITALPNGWVNTAEHFGNSAGDDGGTNGLLAVAVATTSVSYANFGINQLPDGTNIVATPKVNPGGLTQVAVPPLVGSDLEDGAKGAGSTVRIDSIPANARLYYNGVLVTAGQVIPNYNPALLTIDPDNSDASQPNLTTQFKYSFQDAAGFFDAVPNTVTMQFLQPVAIIGTVWNDVNGSAAGGFTGIQNGSETGTDAYGQLYAYVRDNLVGSPTFEQIIRKVQVNPDGTYAFDGLTVAGDVNIYITSDNSIPLGSTTIPPSTLPAGWDNTSPLVRNVVYNNPPGLLVADRDFGIEQLPESNDNTQPLQANPGGTVSVAVPATAFDGEDVAIGTVTGIRITAFPTNATSITINGTVYCPTPAGTCTGTPFPAGGIVIPADAYGAPAWPISVDPAVDGAITVSIPYATIDNAGKEDLSPATVNIPFANLLPVNAITLSAEFNGVSTALNWKVLGERNVAYYEVERSNNAATFVAAGRVNSLGINGDQTYRFTDVLSKFSGSNVYYKVKVVDKDGRSRYSNMLHLTLSAVKDLNVSPNPFRDNLNIQMNVLKDQDVSIRVLNAEGKVMIVENTRLTKGFNSMQLLGADKLAAGSYIVVITLESGPVYRKIVKQ